jgi:hypothetical protein
VSRVPSGIIEFRGEFLYEHFETWIYTQQRSRAWSYRNEGASAC